MLVGVGGIVIVGLVVGCVWYGGSGVVEWLILWLMVFCEVGFSYVDFNGLDFIFLNGLWFLLGCNLLLFGICVGFLNVVVLE